MKERLTTANSQLHIYVVNFLQFSVTVACPNLFGMGYTSQIAKGSLCSSMVVDGERCPTITSSFIMNYHAATIGTIVCGSYDSAQV